MQFGDVVKVVGEVRNKGRVGVVMEVRHSLDLTPMVDVKFDPSTAKEKTLSFLQSDLEVIPVTDSQVTADLIVAADRRGSDTQNERGAGLKYDSGKPQFGLLLRGCARAILGVVMVLTFGARKYSADSWKQVENGEERYKDALYRHLNAIERGELVDPESGLPHIDHIACNAMFLSELHHTRED